jgi:hypothetical protein
MKLLKYVMTHDSGLAPNPFFGTCSLALCTPNHMNARLNPGDWVVAHSSKERGLRLVYAMRLTQVLDMPTYFANFPEKRPDPNGTYEQQCGDNLYYRDGDRWARMPSAEHNTPDDFAKDRNRRVYLAEGEENYWYFGAAASPLPELAGFADRFPWLVKDRQGFSYVREQMRIATFTKWLDQLEKRGLIGQPRDHAVTNAECYLVTVDPTRYWPEPATPHMESHSNGASGCSPTPVILQRKGCGQN